MQTVQRPQLIRHIGMALMLLCCLPGGTEETLRLLPQWIPQAQFAGYYVAQEKGFYTENDIHIEILRGGPEHSPTEALAKGEATFATLFLSEALAAHDQGLDLVNIAQITQRSALMLVARKASGIRHPKDLDGKKVNLWRNFEVQPRALFRKLDIHPTIIPQSATMNLFLRGGVAAASAMWYNEYHLLLNAGLDEEELIVFFFDTAGLNFPEDGLYCLRSTLESREHTCCAFVEASLKGWQYAFEHPEESLDLLMRIIRASHTGANRAHQHWMLERMQDLILPSDASTRLGSLDPQAYALATEELLRCGAIHTAPALEEFHVNCCKKN